MGDRKLRSTVILPGDSGDPPTVLAAGSTPTAEQAKLIDNPKAWDDYVEPAGPTVTIDDGLDDAVAKPLPKKKAPAKKAAKKSSSKK